MDASWTWLNAGVVVQALAHFVWQGFVVWAAVAMLMLVARPRTARARYAIYCGTLAVLAACPMATFVFVAERSVAIGLPGTSSISVTEKIESAIAPSSPYALQRVETRRWNLGNAVEDTVRWLESRR